MNSQNAPAMELHMREYFIYRIISGRYKLGNVFVYPFTDNIRLEAQEKYIDVYDEAFEDGILTDGNMYDILVEEKVWNETRQKELDEIVPKHIEYWKIELYRSLLKSNSRETIRKHLKVAEKELERLYLIRHKYDAQTCEGLAAFAKNQYMISESCFDAAGEKINWSEFDINNVMKKLNLSKLSMSQIRMLARTTPWVNIFSSRKQARVKLFHNEFLTDEQSILLSWTASYENIHKSPDCPSDAVIEDDDVLDGWILLQQRRREKDTKGREAEGLISQNPRINNADEIYIPAETKQDASRIHEMNNPLAEMKRKQRMKQVHDEGMVKEQNLHDLRRDIQMQYNKLNKGKK